VIPTAATILDSSVPVDLLTEDTAWLTWPQTRLVEAAERGTPALNTVALTELAPRFSQIEMLRTALPASWPATPVRRAVAQAASAKRSCLTF
jgi:hypothetical protein